jgi:tRNA(fMet)-specific endonuclease VapC
MYLLDTDWAIDALKGKDAPTKTISALLERRVSISRITVAELYDGAFFTPNPGAAVAQIRSFLTAYRVLEGTDIVAERFGELRSFLRRRGALLEDFDLLIAATAIEQDLTLLTFNRRHFERVPGLRIYEPS